MNLEKFVEQNAPRNRIALLVIVDIFLITLSGFLSLYVRYDFSFSKMGRRKRSKYSTWGVRSQE